MAHNHLSHRGLVATHRIRPDPLAFAVGMLRTKHRSLLAYKWGDGDGWRAFTSLKLDAVLHFLRLGLKVYSYGLYSYGPCSY